MRRRRSRLLCGIALLITVGFAALHLAAPDLRWLRLLELDVFDVRIRLRGPQPVTPRVVIVMIDDATVASLGRWPVPRQALADLIGLLHRAHARAIGIDVLFREAERIRPGEAPGDAALATAMRDAGNVVLPFAFGFGDKATQDENTSGPTPYRKLRQSDLYRPLSVAPTELLLPIPILASSVQLGHMLVAYDVDGVARYEYPAVDYDIDFYPSMAIRLAQLYRGVAWPNVELELGAGIAIGGTRVPTDPETRLLIDYVGPAGSFPTYSLKQVLAGTIPATAFADRIVLVGANVTGAQDRFATPFTAVLPGVERLASVLNSIMLERYLTRPPAMPWLEAVAMLILALILAIAVARLNLWMALLVLVGLLALLAASGQVALTRFGIWQATVVPALALVLTFIALSVYRYALLDREHRHVRRSFQRYLSPAMVERLADSDRLPELGGEARVLSILFCDLRGFTSLSERVEPAQLTRIANNFLTAASDAVLAQGGTVDKYMGDAIMAFWNAPTDQPDHAQRACRAALDIVGRLATPGEGEGAIAAGIGINTGSCIVGNFGSPRRLDYSAIGDPVNTASRLESETKLAGFTILLGAETAAQADLFATLPLGRRSLRGRAEPVEVHGLLGDRNVAGSAMFGRLREAWQANDQRQVAEAWEQLAASFPHVRPLASRFET